MFKNKKFIIISLILALAAISLLFILGTDRIQQNSLPVCGGAVVIHFFIFFILPNLVKQSPQQIERKKQAQAARHQKEEYQKRVKVEVDFVRSRIKDNLRILAEKNPSSHEKAINNLLEYGSIVMKPMCELFSQALFAFVEFSNGPRPEHVIPVDSWGHEANVPTRFGIWEDEAKRLKSLIANLSIGLARLGDPESIPVLLVGFDQVSKCIIKFKYSGEDYFDPLFYWQPGINLADVIKGAIEKITGEKFDMNELMKRI